MSGRSLSFPQLLLESIDEGLSVLGNEPREAVYQFLRTICSLPREDIPDHVPEFAAGLKRALGGASKVIERLILRRLFEKTGSSFRDVPDTDFNEYVLDAKRRFEIVSHRHEDPAEGARSKKGQVSS
ncbi:MAG: hypothetical protein AUG17_00080 [Crenarchaeota archaeon 13_1_20CM_2_53_14]|nr:MAG: hypothetical protein AUG17_00080 [Crenarchaeota archaeon 13_1_20CM_2_53_14]TMI27172.1 MAG: hypothetical protein E6H24_01735 [Candidatus Bathyarchaeota archaeon]